MTEPIALKCSKEGCEIGKGGKCLAGHEDVSMCPNLMPHENESTVVQTEGSNIDLPSGLDLSFEEATFIARARYTRLIIMAGDVKSGKTTLLASIYEHLLRKPIGNYIFAGSKTLLGFDNRCHLARISSGMVVPDIGRTIFGQDDKLLHLRVRVKDLSEPGRDLLFSDFSGERFEAAVNSREECKKLSIIKRADRFVLVIDGQKLSNLDMRQRALHDADQLLRRFIEAEMLTKRSFVDVLCTKYDYIEAGDKKENIAFLENVIETLKSHYSSRLGSMNFFTVAVLPNKLSKFELFHGLESVFVLWVEHSPIVESLIPDVSVDLGRQSEYDKYILRQSRDDL